MAPSRYDVKPQHNQPTNNLIYSCYLTYSAIANASGTVPTHFSHVTNNSTYFTQFT